MHVRFKSSYGDVRPTRPLACSYQFFAGEDFTCVIKVLKLKEVLVLNSGTWFTIAVGFINNAWWNGFVGRHPVFSIQDCKLVVVPR